MVLYYDSITCSQSRGPMYRATTGNLVALNCSFRWFVFLCYFLAPGKNIICHIAIHQGPLYITDCYSRRYKQKPVQPVQQLWLLCRAGPDRFHIVRSWCGLSHGLVSHHPLAAAVPPPLLFSKVIVASCAWPCLSVCLGVHVCLRARRKKMEKDC